MINLRSVSVTVLLTALGSLSLDAQVTGSGTTNYVPIWTGGTALGDSKIYQTGGNVGIGTTSPAWALDVNGNLNVSAGYRIGTDLVLSLPGTGSYNLAVGVKALESNTTGGWNTATGYLALASNTSGANNNAYGFEALYNNTTGVENAAFGQGALASSTAGTANTSVGVFSLVNLKSGENNVALGYEAGENAPTALSNAIYIGNAGASTDTNGIVRIGGSSQTSFFAGGISGVNVSGANVVVNANGQLGVVSSSRRYKEDIHDMGDASSALLRLRPVTFRYKKAFDDGSKPLDYGLIAEEVAEIYPDLAVRGSDGEVQTIQYQKLTPMLLNEVQKQAETIRLLEKRLEALEASLHSAH